MKKNHLLYFSFIAFLAYFNAGFASNYLLEEAEYSGVIGCSSEKRSSVSVASESSIMPEDSALKSSSALSHFPLPRAELLSLLVSSAALPSEDSSENHSTVHYFESMTPEDRRALLQELHMFPLFIREGDERYDWKDLESKDSATVEATQTRWAEKAMEEGDEFAARGVIEHLNNTKQFNKCRALIEKLAEKPECSASNCALLLMLDGYSHGTYGFEKETNPFKMGEMLVSRMRQGHEYAKTLFYEGLMNGKYGVLLCNPNDYPGACPSDPEKKHWIEERQRFIFDAAEQGDKEARRIIVEGHWCGYHSFFKNMTLARMINDNYCRTEMQEPFALKMSQGSALIRKIGGLSTSKSSELYAYVGNKEELDRFFDELIQKGTPEIKAFATAVQLGLVEEKVRKRERIRKEIEDYEKVQKELSRQFQEGKITTLSSNMSQMSYEAQKKYGKIFDKRM